MIPVTSTPGCGDRRRNPQGSLARPTISMISRFRERPCARKGGRVKSSGHPIVTADLHTYIHKYAPLHIHTHSHRRKRHRVPAFLFSMYEGLHSGAKAMHFPVLSSDFPFPAMYMTKASNSACDLLIP